MKIEGFVKLAAEERRRLKLQRIFYESTMDDLAFRLNISERTFYAYEAGERRVPLSTFQKWLDLLGASFSIVYGGGFYGISGSILVGHDTGADQTRAMGAESDGLAVPHAAERTS